MAIKDTHDDSGQSPENEFMKGEKTADTPTIGNLPTHEILLDHDPEARRKIVNRLKRANGQLAGTINLIENDGHCREVVQQLAAVSKAIDRAGFLVIATAMRECMLDEGENAEENRENLEKMFLSLA